MTLTEYAKLLLHSPSEAAVEAKKQTFRHKAFPNQDADIPTYVPTTEDALDDLFDQVMLEKYDRTKNLGKFARETLNP